jgi:hypothetical protein
VRTARVGGSVAPESRLKVADILSNDLAKAMDLARAEGNDELCERLAGLRERRADPDKWVLWIARSMEGPIDLAACPDIGALNYLVECRNEPVMRQEFWRNFVSKASKLSGDGGEEEKADGKLTLDVIGRILDMKQKAEGNG